jgi:hypothetical protein
VISAGSNTLEAIRIHFEDLQNGRNRILEMDTFSAPVVGKRAAPALIDDLDLDLDELYWRQPYLLPGRPTTPKLVHKIFCSRCRREHGQTGCWRRCATLRSRNLPIGTAMRSRSTPTSPSPCARGAEGDDRRLGVPPQYP